MVPALFFEERREPRPCSLVSWNPVRLPERPFAQGSGLFCGFSRAWSRFTYDRVPGSRPVGVPVRAASCWQGGRSAEGRFPERRVRHLGGTLPLPGARGERLRPWPCLARGESGRRGNSASGRLRAAEHGPTRRAVPFMTFMPAAGRTFRVAGRPLSGRKTRGWAVSS